MRSFNILLTCSSNKTQILDWIYKSVKKFNCNIKVFAGDSDNKVISKYFCDQFWHMPKIKDKNYPKILSFCKKKKIKIIIPSSDKELIFWSKFKLNFLKNKIYIMVSDYETINSCLDKLKFYDKLKNYKSTIITSNNLNSFNNKEKLVAKPRFGYGSNEIILNKTKSKIKNQINKYEKNYIFQEYINSKNEISVDCFFSKKNKLLKLVARRRILVKYGESVSTQIIKQNNIFYEIEKISHEFKFSGHVMFQCFINKKKILIFECNPRIGGASVSSFYNKMDSIYYFILESLNSSKVLAINKNIFNKSKILIYKKVKFLK